MLQKQAEKNYLCSLTDKRKTMKHTNPQVEQMTSFIVMDVLERANELQKQVERKRQLQSAKGVRSQSPEKKNGLRL